MLAVQASYCLGSLGFCFFLLLKFLLFSLFFPLLVKLFLFIEMAKNLFEKFIIIYNYFYRYAIGIPHGCMTVPVPTFTHNYSLHNFSILHVHTTIKGILSPRPI